MSDDASESASPETPSKLSSRLDSAGPANEHDDLHDIDLVVVTMTFDAKPTDADNGALLAVLSKYTVLSRMVDGCRNVDLCSSHTAPGRHLIVQKWASDVAQRDHFDSELMVDMARSCRGLLASAPDIDLWEGTSAHDLR